MKAKAVKEVTRQGLYEQVWSMPVSALCRVHGVSGDTLAEVCKRWGIPRPPPGWWTKKRAGPPGRPRPLPPIEDGDPVVLGQKPEPARTAAPKTNGADGGRPAAERPGGKSGGGPAKPAKPAKPPEPATTRRPLDLSGEGARAAPTVPVWVAPPAPRPAAAGQMAVFQPPVRLVALVASLCPAGGSEEDLGGYSIYIEICPVLAVQAIAPSGPDDPVEYEAVVLEDGGIRCQSDIHDRCQVSIHACPWPPEEDQTRLAGQMKEARISLQAYAGYLRSQGEPIWHGVGSLPPVPPTQTTSATLPPRRRKPAEPKKGTG